MSSLDLTYRIASLAARRIDHEEAAAEATRDLREAVLAAHAAGAGKSELARAAGVSRQTIHEWTKEEK